MKRKHDKLKCTCNQCHYQMTKVELEHYNWKLSITVCYNPKCPNYALWQTPMELIK